MPNTPGAIGARPDRHEDGLDDQLAIWPRTHGPAHHEPGIQIEDDTQVQPVLGGPYIGGIDDPFGIGSGGSEVSLQMVAGASRRCPGWLGAPTSPLREAAQASAAHQTGHPVAPTSLPGVPLILPDPRTPNDAVGISMELTNPGEEPGVLLVPCTRPPRRPAIIPAGRYAQTPTHQSEGKSIAASLDHPILHFDALAKNAAASRKKSRSFVTRANSRRSWLTSSSRDRP